MLSIIDRAREEGGNRHAERLPNPHVWYRRRCCDVGVPESGFGDGTSGSKVSSYLGHDDDHIACES